MSVDLLDRDQVRHGGDHATDLRPVLLHDDVAHPLQTERAQRFALAVRAADRRSALGDLQARHQTAAPSALAARGATPGSPARARSIAVGATSSIANPRRAAISSGRCRPCSAATVACTMLIGLDEPSDLLSTSWIPAHSSTARTGPPAITPVPALAGLSSTTPAAASPCTGWVMLRWMRGTEKKCFLASSTPLAIAAGTSLALP